MWCCPKGGAFGAEPLFIRDAFGWGPPQFASMMTCFVLGMAFTQIAAFTPASTTLRLGSPLACSGQVGTRMLSFGRTARKLPAASGPLDSRKRALHDLAHALAYVQEQHKTKVVETCTKEDAAGLLLNLLGQQEPTHCQQQPRWWRAQQPRHGLLQRLTAVPSHRPCCVQKGRSELSVDLR